MANYAVTDIVVGPGSLVQVAALMETAIETIDTAKTLRLVAIYHLYGDKFQGVVIHDA